MAKRSFVYHILFWALLYVLWVCFFQNRMFTLTKTMTVEFCYLVFIAIDYYIITSFITPRLLYKKKYFLFIVATLLLIGVSAVARTGIAGFMNFHFFLPGRPQPPFNTVLFNSFINILIWVQALVAGKMLMDKISNHQYIAVIEREKAKNELDFLKAQINPHFMFNSLNSIYGHIDKNNRTARSILLKFSEMLRYQLYECNADKISIEKEIEYIRSYVVLQQYRKEENLIVQLQVDDNVQGVEIAPLLLVVFVENAFKYVSNSDEKENRLSILFSCDNNILLFKVFNTTEYYPVRDSMARKGIGIANVKRRLEILYPGKHHLDIHEHRHSYEVNLNIDLS